jgi:hypothetical protein
MPTRLEISIRFLGEDQILRSQRQSVDEMLKWTQPAQWSWKQKPRVETFDIESRGLQNLLGLERRNHDRVTIKWNLAHHVSSARVPRIVLPECEPTAWLKRIENGLQSDWAIIWHDVMKHAVAVGQVEMVGGNVSRYKRETC